MLYTLPCKVDMGQSGYVQLARAGPGSAQKSPGPNLRCPNIPPLWGKRWHMHGLFHHGPVCSAIQLSDCIAVQRNLPSAPACQLSGLRRHVSSRWFFEVVLHHHRRYVVFAPTTRMNSMSIKGEVEVENSVVVRDATSLSLSIDIDQSRLVSPRYCCALLGTYG
jgi:hypothetical protein